MRQKIIKVGDGKFRVNWDDVKYQKDVINLDFNPLINIFNLKQYPSYLLLHWQSRPKGLRRWGIYDGQFDQYYGCDFDKMLFQEDSVNLQLLQIDETKLLLPPSAVVLLPNQSLNYNNETIKCYKSV